MPAPAHKPRETLYEPRFPHPGVYLLPILILPTASALGAISIRRLIPGLPEWPIPVVGVCVALIVVAKWIFDLHRIRLLLRTHGRFLCLNCHYALTGLPDSGACPECDHPYQRDVNERRWKTWEETVNKGKPMV
ncbi:MAG TPA: hypothetical protein PKE29_18145 [Phycisphaerales bacterium]|nr:hypothetical protein [Phycisphaerales bacterium]